MDAAIRDLPMMVAKIQAKNAGVEGHVGKEGRIR